MSHPFIKHLLEDHEEQRRLAKALSEAKTATEKEEYRQKLYEAISPHLEGEEASIFDFLKSQDEEVRADALEALQEHHVDRCLLGELMELDVEGEVLTAKAKVLEEINNHHLKEEEEKHFPRMETLASDDQMDELFQAYKAAEAKAQEKKA